MVKKWNPLKHSALGAKRIDVKFFPDGAEDPDFHSPQGLVASVEHESTGLYTVTLSEGWYNDSDGYSDGLLGISCDLITAVAGSNSAEVKGIDADAKTISVATYDGGVLTDFALANTTFVCLGITIDTKGL